MPFLRAGAAFAVPLLLAQPRLTTAKIDAAQAAAEAEHVGEGGAEVAEDRGDETAH